MGLTLLLVMTSAFGADEADQPATTVGFILGQDKLSNNTPDWRERTLQFQQRFAKRHTLEFDLSEFERFGMRDSQLGFSYTRPLSKELTATLDGNLSPTHRVIAKNAIGGELQYEFVRAWLLHAGGRTTRYNDVTVNSAIIGIEHYFSNFSWVTTWHSSRVFGTTANSGELRGNYYYGDKSSIGLIMAAGDEAANTGGAVTITRVRALALVGRHWFDPRWSVNYGIGHTRQGNLYNRDSINLGIQYAF